MGPEEPGPVLTRRLALKGLGALGAGALGVTGCTGRDPVGAALIPEARLTAAPPPGTLLWDLRPPGTFSSMVAVDGLLCVDADVSTNVSGVYAMHADTGRKAWTRYGDDDALAPFAAQAGVVFCVGVNGVEALRAADGKALWTTYAGTVNLGSASTWVLVIDGTVCTTAELGGGSQKPREVVLGLDSRTGRRKWAAKFPSVPTGLTSAAGLVFAGSPAPPFKASAGKVAALEPATGSVAGPRLICA